MLSVYKYDLEMADEITLSLPKGAQILRVDVQREDKLVLWALVEPGRKSEVRKIRIAGTGHSIGYSPNTLYYINTFTMHAKFLWFHAFEVL